MNSTATETSSIPIKDRLRIAAEHAGSLKALSELAEIPYPTLMRYIKGTEPKREALANIVNRLNIDGTWLLTGKGSPKGGKSTEELNSSKNVELPKFSPKIFRELLDNAEDFETRGMAMRNIYSALYTTETIDVDRYTVLRLFGSETPEVAVYNYYDRRTNKAPVQIFVDLFDPNFKQGEEALILLNTSLYILEARDSRSPDRQLFTDTCKIDPIADISLEDLMRSDGLVGKVVGSTYGHRK
jgi:hypothetical protein